MNAVILIALVAAVAAAAMAAKKEEEPSAPPGEPPPPPETGITRPEPEPGQAQPAGARPTPQQAPSLPAPERLAWGVFDLRVKSLQNIINVRLVETGHVPIEPTGELDYATCGAMEALGSGRFPEFAKAEIERTFNVELQCIAYRAPTPFHGRNEAMNAWSMAVLSADPSVMRDTADDLQRWSRLAAGVAPVWASSLRSIADEFVQRHRAALGAP